MDEWQSLSLRLVSEHRGRDQGSQSERHGVKPFAYSRVADVDQAVSQISTGAPAKFLGGGTNLIDLMKMGVETPERLLDINHLPLAQVEELPNGQGLRIGAL